MSSKEELEATNDPECNICSGEGWVCENHSDKAWGHGDGCCGGAGMPCKCNTSNPPWHHGQIEIIETNIIVPIKGGKK